MKNKVKKIVKFLSKKIVDILFNFNSGRYFLEKLNLNTHNKKYKVRYKNKEYNFHIPNRMNYYRAQTFLSKEPETIKWIESFHEGSVFWDIGANIGIYSCFASKEKKTKTFSFEPSVFNLEILAKNIFSNNLSNEIVIVPLSLTNKFMISDFNMSKVEYGGSRSTFSEKYDEDGNSFSPVFKYKTLGMSGDDLIKKFNLEKPDYIKIDVDGIEYLILSGLSEILNNTKSILLEVTDNFKVKKEDIKKFLEINGFIMENKKYFDLNKFNPGSPKVYNQIWKKNI